LEKLFTGFAREPRQKIGQPMADSSSPSKPVKGQKLVLSKSDYDNILNTYRRILESQQKLDQSLALYRKDLEGFGELLEDTPVSPQAKVAP
jgi:hypothetical protein